MKNRLFLLALAAVITLTITGCGAKPKVGYKGGYKDGSAVATIKIRNSVGTPSWSINERNALEDALQVAAEATISKGYKYFAFFSPNEISNVKAGSLINTAEEFLEKCDPSNADLLANIAGGVGLHKCGVYNNSATMVIIMHHEQQDNYVTYDAQAVVDYLKREDIYDADNSDMEFMGLAKVK
jgi:hypothetical protein